MRVPIRTGVIATGFLMYTPLALSEAVESAAASFIPPGCELTCASFTTACYGKYTGYAYRQIDVYNACRRDDACLSVMYEWDPAASYYFSFTKEECLDSTVGGPYGYQRKWGYDGSLCPFIPDLYPACHS